MLFRLTLVLLSEKTLDVGKIMTVLDNSGEILYLIQIVEISRSVEKL